MNGQRDPDAILATWLEEGPTRLPDATRRAIAVSTATTHQARRPMWSPWRYPFMNTYAKLAVAAVVVAVVGAAGLALLGPGLSGLGGPVGPSPSTASSPTPTALVATPSPSSSPSASPSALAASGFVYPGRYLPAFDPPMAFTIDREVEHNCAQGFTCRGSIDGNLAGYLELEFGQPRIGMTVVRVDQLKNPRNPGTLMDPPADLAGWIAARPGLTVISQQAVTIGGVVGTRLDVVVGNKDVIIGPIPGVSDHQLAFGKNSATRIAVLTVAGHAIVILAGAEDGSVNEVQPLVDSIVWR